MGGQSKECADVTSISGMLRTGAGIVVLLKASVMTTALMAAADMYAGHGFGRLGRLGNATSVFIADASATGRDMTGSVLSENDSGTKETPGDPSLQLRRGGVRVRGTSAVQSAIDGSFVTSVSTVLVWDSGLSVSLLAYLLLVFSRALAVEGCAIRLTRDDDGLTSWLGIFRSSLLM